VQDSIQAMFAQQRELLPGEARPSSASAFRSRRRRAAVPPSYSQVAEVMDSVLELLQADASAADDTEAELAAAAQVRRPSCSVSCIARVTWP
jgi:hypothetical protein